MIPFYHRSFTLYLIIGSHCRQFEPRLWAWCTLKCRNANRWCAVKGSIGIVSKTMQPLRMSLTPLPCLIRCAWKSHGTVTWSTWLTKRKIWQCEEWLSNDQHEEQTMRLLYIGPYVIRERISKPLVFWIVVFNSLPSVIRCCWDKSVAFCDQVAGSLLAFGFESGLINGARSKLKRQCFRSSAILSLKVRLMTPTQTVGTA